MGRISTLALLCALLFVPAGKMYAQAVSSSLDGTVTDSSGAVVPGATLTLANLSTGTAVKSKSDEAGRYAFPSIAVGTYRLTVKKEGFRTYELSNFKIMAAQHTSHNVVLRVGTVTQTVTVNAEGLSMLLQSGSNDLGTLIEPKMVTSLPLNGRNFLQLGLLSGATTGTAGPGQSTDMSQQYGRFNMIQVGGNENDFTMYLVNGVQMTGTRTGNVALELPLGAIDQFVVHYGFFMPDMGSNPGVVDLITKSGGNRLHGEAFEFLRNNKLDARNFFSPTPPAPFHRNQFGADVGGPIRKNKIFFFADYEGLRQSLSQFVGAFAPTAAMFNGDFSALSTPIYNPSTYDATTGQRQQFSYNGVPNVIDPALINSVSQKLLKYYLPGSSYSLKPINVSGNPLTTLDYDQFTGRVDVNLSERNRIYGQYSYENSPSTTPGLMPLSGKSNPLAAQLAMFNWSSDLTSNMVNELRLAYARDDVWDMGPEQNGLQNQLGITGTSDPNGVPGIGIIGIGGFGSALGQLGDVDDSYQIHDSFSWLRGNHMIKFGEDLNYLRTIQMSANANARGWFNFNDTYTAQLTTNAQGAPVPVANTGNSFADFLLGLPTQAGTLSMPRTHFRWTDFEPYVQDSWKVRPGLTLNYGLAYFLTTPPNPVGPDKNLVSGFDLKTGHFIYASLGQMPVEVYPTRLTNFAPRVGLAWEPKFVKQTTVRAGWGIYYTAQDFYISQYEISNPGVTVSQSITNLQPTPTYVLGVNAMPSLSIHPITQQYQQSVTGAGSFISPDYRPPYIEQWTLDIQHLFGKNDLLDMAYLGNEGHHLMQMWQANDCAVGNTLQCSTSAMPYGTAFPYIVDILSTGNSNYQALLLKFQHQFSRGISLLANYTFSKTMVMGAEGGNGTIDTRGNCRSCDSGPAMYSVPQSFSLSGIWQLPFGHGHQWLGNSNKFVNAVAAGWGLDSIVTLQAGTPFTVTAPNVLIGGYRTVHADRLCNGRSELSNTNLRTNGGYWFDTACFAPPPSGYFGTSGMGILVGPGLNNWDMSLEKDNRISEAMNLQFRAEFFNAFNHAQFAQPDATVGGANFGRVTQTQHDNREIQFGLRLIF